MVSEDSETTYNKVSNLEGENHMKEMVLSSEEILAITKELGAEISEDLKSEAKLPLFVCVLKGAMKFMVDLLKHVTIPNLEDYVHLCSYDGTKSTGKVELIQDLSYDIDDRTVVIVEDVVDSGITMDFLIRHLKQKGHPKRILVCALFDKRPPRQVEVQIDYVGKVLHENKFLLGYGLDYRGLKRNVPYVYVPSDDEIASMDALLQEKGEI